MPSGKIGFDSLPVRCIIGDLPKERKQEQTIFFNLRIAWDFYACAESDSLDQTVDYLRLKAICEEVAQKGRFRMLETLAVRAVEAIYKELPIKWAWIQIKKHCDESVFVVEWEWAGP